MRIYKTSKYREKFKEQEMTFCNSCQESNPIYNCPICNMKIKGQCRECHNELSHSHIENSNIETFRNDSFSHLAPRQRAKKI